MTKKNKNESRSQLLFGIRCVLLALVLIMISGSILYAYISGEGLDTADVSFRAVAIVCTAVVLFFEIRTYSQLYNEGVRTIYREKNVELDKLDKFKRLVDKNEFVYNFQPIVDAKTGEIYAYEVLMRTGDDIGLKPLEVLKYAEISNMLYNVERCTFFNVLRYYKENKDKFGNKKIFINSIPSVILADSELEKLRAMTEGISENIVVEILESSDDDDDSISAFDNLRDILNCNIAIDDYGSGYSNDMKVLNNNPNYIKIDISLITSIDTDSKKQLLVSNLIKFGKKYNIKILAEGVETKEELSKVIELGADLIQGFYTARPNPQVLQQIDSEISEFIIEENVRLSKYDNEQRVYDATEGEIINLFSLSLEKYTMINVACKKVHFLGTKNHIVDMVIRVADGISSELTFENVNIKGATETTVQIGKKSSLTIVLIGDNTFNKEGIHVPDGSSLILTGSGNLSVKNNRNGGVGIGSDFRSVYGSITVDIGGSLCVDSTGDKIVCIGGGEKGAASSVKLLSGNVSVKARGITVIGVGSASGDTNISVSGTASLSTKCIANEAVSVGTMYGTVDINVSGTVDAQTDGERITGIGVLNGGSGEIVFTDGRASSVIHGDVGTAVGSLGGSVDIQCCGGRVFVHAEGTRICGIGALDAGGTVRISSGIVISEILSAEPIWIGNPENQVVVTGGNIITSKDNVINAVNSYGDRLSQKYIDDRTDLSETVNVSGGSYTYRARRDDESGKLCVYLPEQISR